MSMWTTPLRSENQVRHLNSRKLSTFRQFIKLVELYRIEYLLEIACRPVDGEVLDRGCIAEADLGSQRRTTEGTACAYLAVHRAVAGWRTDFNRDPGSERSSI